MDQSRMSEAMKFALLPIEVRRTILSQMTEKQLAAMPFDWEWNGRPQQLETIHQFMDNPQFSYCIALAGRGWGKTKTGAEWVRHLIENCGYKRGAIVAPTAGDARDVMIEGESGILSVCPEWNYPLYTPANRRLTWPNGAVCTVYSADEPRRLRGANSEFAWCDELAAWERAQDAWDMLAFGLRIGPAPKALITTTPQPIKALMDLLEDEASMVIEGSTYDNRVNLNKKFFDNIIRKYEGTTLGEQEIMGRVLRNMGGLFKPDYILRVPENQLPHMARIVVAVDPAAKSKATSDDTGIAVCGKGVDNRYYLLHVEGQKMSPGEWADRVAKLYNDYKADKIVAEANNGGEMVEFTIQKGYKDLPVEIVNASRGKVKRAEPISLLYQKGRVSHVKYKTRKSGGAYLVPDSMQEAEKQMYTFRNDPKYDGTSSDGTRNDDMADAIIWGFSELAMNEFREYQAPVVTGVRGSLVSLRLM